MEIFGVTPLERYIPDDNFADLNITKEDLYIDLKRSIDTLTTVESQVIRLYFGVLLDDYPDVKHALTLEEIGCMLDLHRERVRQIMEKAIRRLKHPGRSRVLRKYL
jgi:RNA polymerase primary sigma factor